MRFKAILEDAGSARRRRRVALFLLHRLNTAESLSIALLIAHLNDLEDKGHVAFIQDMFGDLRDYDPLAWRKRVDKLVTDVGGDEGSRSLMQHTPEWLAFFLHAATHAGWMERERASTLFREAGGAVNSAKALMLVGPARATAVQLLLTDIAASEGRCCVTHA